jgi:NAD(P)-dependent dehydrogenase (short-subunit alcohol dehydrogenase family)
VVHLLPIGREPIRGGARVWLEEAGATTRSLFSLLKATAADLGALPDAVVLAATAMGGDWGARACRPGAEMAAGCHGLLRSFEREQPTIASIVVDVNEERPAEELAAQIVREYLIPDVREVGYLNGARLTAVPEDVPLDDDRPLDETLRPAAGWVVLATGGARGITAGVCEELAAPGVRFVLVGRGVPAAGGALDDERRQVVAALELRGAEVTLLQADVADAAAFGAAIDEVYARFGRIDAVLHGAGVIEDQRLELKPLDAFDRVFNTKVSSTISLAGHLRTEGLRWVVLFGSVSGRFGNPGQTDYAAANEVLNRLALTLGRQWPSTRVAAINWGPWRGLGMASDAAVALMAARGITAIIPSSGRRFLVRELLAGARDDAVVVAGAGPWRQADRRPQVAQAAQAPVANSE